MFKVTIDALPPGTGLCEALVAWFGESDVQCCGGRLLNVGAGSGLGPCGPAVADLFREVVGVDPNPDVTTNPTLTASWVATAQEFAAKYDGARFDAACSVYVVEHVKEPLSFLAAVRETLRPGAQFYCVTPNLHHYFVLAARLSALTRVEKPLLRWLVGREWANQYHYHAYYRLNSLRRIRRTAQAAGYRSLDVRYLDNPDILQPYFSKIFSRFPELYSRWVHRNALYSLFATLLFRLTN